MKPLSPDTTPDAQRKLFELMGRLTPEQKLSMALALTEATRQLIMADLRHRFPEAGNEEIRRRFIARVLPRETVICAYGFDPKVEGFEFQEDWHSVRNLFELHTPKALANFQPRVGAKRQPWVTNA